MRRTTLRVCFGLILVYSLPARPEVSRALGNGSATDVGPEAGLVFANVSQPFLFRSREEILVTSGRAGIYKSIDGGQSWARSESGLLTSIGVEPFALGFCQSRSAPEIAYLATNQDGVSRTTDFGESWEPLTSTPNTILLDCAVDPLDADVVYVLALFDPVHPGLLFKSTDGGRSFFTVGAGLPDQLSAFAVAVAATNQQTVYVGSTGDGALYASSDGGLNFEALPNAPAFVGRVYPHPTQDGTLLVFARDGLFLSTDSGAFFSQVGAGLPPLTFALAFDPSDTSVIYVPARVDGLFRSGDGALTFERVSGLGEAELLGLGVTAVGVSPGDAEDPPILYAGTSLGPFRSDDSGDTFVPIHNGYRGGQVQDVAIDAAGRLLVATQNSVGVFRSTERGVYQVIGDTLPRDTATTLHAVAAAPDDPERYVVVGAEPLPSPFAAVFWTSDGGSSWSQAGLSGDMFYTGRMRFAFAPSDSSRVYLVTTQALWRSDDGGESFTRTVSMPLGSIAVDPTNADVLYVGTWFDIRGVFKSTDGGRTLQQLGASGDIIAIALDPLRPQVIYAGLRTGTVIRSLNGGQLFSPAAVGLSGDRVLGLGVDPGQPMRLFVWMHAGGLFRSEDGADSWTAVDTEETLRRSAVQAGQPSLAIEGGDPVRVYLGNASVLQFVNQ